MYFKKLVIPIAGSFTAGFSLAYLVYKDEFKSLGQPLLAREQPTMDMTVYQPNQLIGKQYSKDDLVANKSARIGEMMKHGYPSLDNLRVFDDYVLSYDRRSRVPNWVFEHLTPAKMRSAEETDRGKSEFQEDSYFHQYFRATNSDYKGSGYDRGHMAAAANHRLAQAFMDQTFMLSNIAPQVGAGFNRDKWAELEKYVRGMVRKNDNVWVCTGPLYLPRKESDGKTYIKYEVIGQNNVAVPTHFFKVVVSEKAGEYHLMSYVMPNAPCDNSTPLANYLVPLDSIERSAGFLLFDKLQRNRFKSINKK